MTLIQQFNSELRKRLAVLTFCGSLYSAGTGKSRFFLFFGNAPFSVRFFCYHGVVKKREGEEYKETGLSEEERTEEKMDKTPAYYSEKQADATEKFMKKTWVDGDNSIVAREKRSEYVRVDVYAFTDDLNVSLFSRGIGAREINSPLPTGKRTELANERRQAAATRASPGMKKLSAALRNGTKLITGSRFAELPGESPADEEDG